MKYYGTKNNRDYGFYEENFESAIEITDEYWSNLLDSQNEGKRIILFQNSVIAIDENEYEQTDGVWTKLSDEESSKKRLKAENAVKVFEIQSEIDELDKKRIRALCEPELKDSEAGITWLDYYNSQILELRNRIKELSA